VLNSHFKIGVFWDITSYSSVDVARLQNTAPQTRKTVIFVLRSHINYGLSIPTARFEWNS